MQLIGWELFAYLALHIRAAHEYSAPVFIGLILVLIVFACAGAGSQSGRVYLRSLGLFILFVITSLILVTTGYTIGSAGEVQLFTGLVDLLWPQGTNSGEGLTKWEDHQLAQLAHRSAGLVMVLIGLAYICLLRGRN